MIHDDQFYFLSVCTEVFDLDFLQLAEDTASKCFKTPLTLDFRVSVDNF